MTPPVGLQESAVQGLSSSIVGGTPATRAGCKRTLERGDGGIAIGFGLCFLRGEHRKLLWVCESQCLSGPIQDGDFSVPPIGEPKIHSGAEKAPTGVSVPRHRSALDPPDKIHEAGSNFLPIGVVRHHDIQEAPHVISGGLDGDRLSCELSRILVGHSRRWRPLPRVRAVKVQKYVDPLAVRCRRRDVMRSQVHR